MRLLRSARALPFGALPVAMGCHSAPPPVAPAPPPLPIAAPRVIPGTLDPRVLLTDLPERAAHLGAGPVSLVASDELSEGERVGAFVEVPANSCLLAYGRASPTVDDLDVEVYSEQGTPVAVDEAPDEHPTVLVCPPHPERLYVSAHAATGEGLVVLAAHLVPREVAQAVGSGFGARGGVPDSHPVDSSWPGLSEALASHRAALGGKWQEFRRSATVVDARAPSFVDVAIEANQCVDALLLTDDQVVLADGELQDDGGRVIARVHDVNGGRAVTVCSSFAMHGSLSIRPHLGRGLVAIVLSKMDASASASLDGHAEIVWRAATLPLARARSLREGALEHAGYAKSILSKDGDLLIGRRASFPIPPGTADKPCVRIDVVGGAPTALFDMSAWEDGGGLIEKTQGGESVTLVSCGSTPTHADLEARGRPGPYSLLVRSERWQSPLFAKFPVAAGRMLARSAALPEAVPGEVRQEHIDAGHVMSFEELVPAGGCSRFIVGVEGDGAGMELRVFDGAQGDEIDRATGERSTDGRACAAAGTPRTVRVEVSLFAGAASVVAATSHEPLHATTHE